MHINAITDALKKHPLAVRAEESTYRQFPAPPEWPNWRRAFEFQSVLYTDAGAGLIAKGGRNVPKGFWGLTGKGREWLKASDDAIIEFAVARFLEALFERYSLSDAREFVHRMNDDARARMRESLSRVSESDVGDNPKQIAHLWRKHYNDLPDSDKALLPLRFIAFPDREKIGIK